MKTKTGNTQKKRFKPMNRLTAIDKLVRVCKSQEKTITSLLENIRGNTSATHHVMVEKSTPKTIHPKSAEALALDEKFKKYDYNIFLENLKQIGRPAMTKEIATRIRRNPKYKSITRNKKRFMQFIYSGVSHFVKQGILNRKPIGKRSFEYSIKANKYNLAA